MDMDYGHGHSHGGYRGDPRMQSSRMHSPSVPITTITTGISLSDRFKVIQQSQVERSSFSDEGYGLPPSSRRLPGLGGMGASRGVPKAVSMRNQQLAMALAKRARATVQQAPIPRPLFRNRGRFRGGGGVLPVQSRLGIKPSTLAGRGLRRGASHALAGRVPGLNRIQKSAGAIGRQISRGGGGNNQSYRFGFAAQRGRGSFSRGAAGRSRGGILPAAGRGRGAGRGNIRGGGRGVGRGGRGGNRRGGRGGVSGDAGPPKREDLDKELDSYMSNSRAYLDRQLDDYMLKAKAASAAITAGTVVVEDADVNMVDA